jgi:TPR repeat protein
MIRGIVIALILYVLATPFVTEAEAAPSSEANTAQITTLRQQAAAGSAVAQFRLGEVFQRGQHVPQDMTAAHHFFQSCRHPGAYTRAIPAWLSL